MDVTMLLEDRYGLVGTSGTFFGGVGWRSNGSDDTGGPPVLSADRDVARAPCTSGRRNNHDGRHT